MSWRWVSKQTVLAVHDEQIREHGGAAGVRDDGLLESALARPRNLAAYGEPSFADLAAAYTYGIIRNHPFVDGNKRTGLVVGVAFVNLNGGRMNASEVAAVETILRLAAGDLSEAQLADWFAQHLLASR